MIHPCPGAVSRLSREDSVLFGAFSGPAQPAKPGPLSLPSILPTHCHCQWSCIFSLLDEISRLVHLMYIADLHLQLFRLQRLEPSTAYSFTALLQLHSHPCLWSTETKGKQKKLVAHRSCPFKRCSCYAELGHVWFPVTVCQAKLWQS
jgi:hypothetical protein